MLTPAEATKFKRLAQRARTSRNKAIGELKAELIDFLPNQDPIAKAGV